MPADVAPPNWYDVTWNPIAGCSPTGPGCAHCEAVRTVAQLARMGGKGGSRYAGLTTTSRAGVEWTGELRVRDDVLAWPLLQRRTRRILVNSLSDLFHEQLATKTIDAVHAVMTVAHWHRFLVQTRRATRMRAYYIDPETPRRIAVEIGQLAEKMLPGANSAPGEAGTDAPIPPGNANARRAWTAGLGRGVTPDAAVLGP
jgi:protein gp37